jgi:hypothetical protein
MAFLKKNRKQGNADADFANSLTNVVNLLAPLAHECGMKRLKPDRWLSFTETQIRERAWAAAEPASIKEE